MTALENALKPGPWLFGDQFTAADLYLASGLGFGMQFGLVDKRPTFVQFVERAQSRPAFRRATEIEQREAAKK
jgi:glutathione S-transferase